MDKFECSIESRKLNLHLTLSQTSLGFYVYAVQVFGNTVGKGEIAHFEQFLLLLRVIIVFPFSSNLKLFSANSFSLGESKIYCLGKG